MGPSADPFKNIPSLSLHWSSPGKQVEAWHRSGGQVRSPHQCPAPPVGWLFLLLRARNSAEGEQLGLFAFLCHSTRLSVWDDTGGAESWASSTHLQISRRAWSPHVREQVGVASHLVNVNAVLLPVCQATPYESLERREVPKKFILCSRYFFDNKRLHTSILKWLHLSCMQVHPPLLRYWKQAWQETEHL